jgi:hypothetical protein
MTTVEKLRREKALALLRKATGGYHTDSVATVLRISSYEASQLLAALEREKLVERYQARGSRLWRATPEKGGE